MARTKPIPAIVFIPVASLILLCLFLCVFWIAFYGSFVFGDLALFFSAAPFVLVLVLIAANARPNLRAKPDRDDENRDSD